MTQFKKKLLRSIFRFLIRRGGHSLRSPTLAPVTYALADFMVKNFVKNDEILEIQGLKIKRGRTARLSLLTGEIEPSLTDFIKEEVKKGMVVFDLGANIGWFTLCFSKLVADSGHVYSFEPDPTLFETLKENVKLNNLNNVTVVPLAVSSKSGKAKLYINCAQDGDNRLDSKTLTDNIIDVETTTLDDFCGKNDIKPDFIKMDIQGSEPKAFKGMEKILATNFNFKIFTEFWPKGIIDVGSSPENFLSSLENYGFTVKEIVEGPQYRVIDINREKLLKAKNDWFNLLCYKN